MNLLPWTITLSFAGAFVALLWPARRAADARWIALATSLATLVLGLRVLAGDPATGREWTTLASVPWIPSLGITFHLAADGISVVLVVLTGLAAVAGVLFSWNVRDRVRGFFSLYMLLIAGVYGVFLSADLFLLFVFYELAIVPKYFLIAIWGSTNREYGAMKLALYSFAGSALVLVGLLVTYVAGGLNTFDLATLAAHPLAATSQAWLFPLVFIGFAVLAGLWPLHTWAPTGHVAAPTAGSMLLAGVVMKLGAYGCLRVAMPLFPAGLAQWQMPFAVLAVAGIVHGALVSWVQKDFKFVIAYSSVSHMGFVLLGLMTLNAAGLSGAVLQMVSHGIIAGLLFAGVGRMVYDRTHTRDLDQLSALRLGQRLPFAAITFVLAGLASMGMPGFSGFVAELAVLQGAWTAFPGLTVLAGVGVFFAAAYILRAIRLAFYPDTETAPANAEPMEKITIAEITGALLLLAATIYLGLQPARTLEWIDAGLQSPLMRGLIGGAR